MAVKLLEICACGHTRAAHQHHRAGTECSLCDPGVCTGFRGTGVIAPSDPPLPPPLPDPLPANVTFLRPPAPPMGD